eukprot:CAMPEP_0177545916 /NCGR_PEP_ID=MMETSP0369-20130122/62907_1 /TAXON_ID=447022 ORGANISM="Scrippsiella hangoei-like, Strain SHHI-4" /NCGR_SAMPLE_ID=MMETSP0369 /ASSEMBLY_ACC=CAM_ASM_000364 /LENGTH=33 /DNA_ID= /DNA_START= /DNA_END= /DNA_ORIENTATION=
MGANTSMPRKLSGTTSFESAATCSRPAWPFSTG